MEINLWPIERGRRGVELNPGKTFTLDTAMSFYFLKKVNFYFAVALKRLKIYIAFSNAQMTIALQVECKGENFPLIKSFTLDCIVLVVFFSGGGMFKQNFINTSKLVYSHFCSLLTSRNKPLADGKGEEGGWAEAR